MELEYKKCKDSANSHHICDIINICKQCGMVQQVVQYCVYVYYKTSTSIEYEYDITTTVFLGCKLANVVLDLDFLCSTANKYFLSTTDSSLKQQRSDMKIEYTREFNSTDAKKRTNNCMADYIVKRELDYCVEIDFNFNIKDYVSVYKNVLRTNRLSKKTSQILWVLANDCLYRPLYIFYPVESVLTICLYFACRITKENDEVCNFVKEMYKIEDTEMKFIVSEIVEMYEGME